MSISVGTPMLKLNNKPSPNKKNSRSGNAKAIIKEMLENDEGDRFCSDEDFRPEDTCKNIYLEDVKTQQQAFDYIDNAVANYSLVDKNGNVKKMRSDAVLAMTGIIKPDMESMSSMSETEQITFLRDYYAEAKQELENRGLDVFSAVIHMDEANPHIHYLALDHDFKLSHKVNLDLYRAFNQELPERMNKKGYDVKKLIGYDVEATKTMTPDEKEAYKQSYIKTKKEKRNASRRSSRDYKANKDAEKIIANAERILDTARATDKDYEREHEARTSTLDEREKALNARKSDLDAREHNLSIKEQKLVTANATAIKMQQELNEKLEEVHDRESHLNHWQDELDKSTKLVNDKYKTLAETYKVLHTLPSSNNDLVKFTKAVKYKDGSSVFDRFEKHREDKVSDVKSQIPQAFEKMLDASDNNKDDDQYS